MVKGFRFVLTDRTGHGRLCPDMRVWVSEWVDESECTLCLQCMSVRRPFWINIVVRLLTARYVRLVMVNYGGSQQTLMAIKVNEASMSVLFRSVLMLGQCRARHGNGSNGSRGHHHLTSIHPSIHPFHHPICMSVCWSACWPVCCCLSANWRHCWILLARDLHTLYLSKCYY